MIKKCYDGSRQRVLLVSVAAVGRTGQRNATISACCSLGEMGVLYRDFTFPARSSLGCVSSFIYCIQILCSFLYFMFLFIHFRPTRVWVNLGQTFLSFLREGLVVCISRICMGRSRVYLSLHGNAFLFWSKQGIMNWIFYFILGMAKRISVLGPRQTAGLISNGLKIKSIFELPNTIYFDDLKLDVIEQLRIAGNANRKGGSDTVKKILFLSNLIEGKGFDLLLNSVSYLRRRKGCDLKLVICGRHPVDERVNQMTSQQVLEINKNSNADDLRKVSVEYIDGAYGVKKWQLLFDTHIFVLPTSYVVESQPIVIIEAMFAGAAIITSNQGEISHLVGGGKCAKILEVPILVEYLVDYIDELTSDDVFREKMTQEAFRLFSDKYSIMAHSQNIMKFLF